MLDTECAWKIVSPDNPYFKSAWQTDHFETYMLAQPGPPAPPESRD